MLTIGQLEMAILNKLPLYYVYPKDGAGANDYAKMPVIIGKYEDVTFFSRRTGKTKEFRIMDTFNHNHAIHSPFGDVYSMINLFTDKENAEKAIFFCDRDNISLEELERRKERYRKAGGYNEYESI